MPCLSIEILAAWAIKRIVFPQPRGSAPPPSRCTGSVLRNKQRLFSCRVFLWDLAFPAMRYCYKRPITSNNRFRTCYRALKLTCLEHLIRFHCTTKRRFCQSSYVTLFIKKVTFPFCVFCTMQAFPSQKMAYYTIYTFFFTVICRLEEAFKN